MSGVDKQSSRVQASPDPLGHLQRRHLAEAGAGSTSRTVATAQDFLSAVQSPVDEIVINDHLDLRRTPVQSITAAADRAIRVCSTLFADQDRPYCTGCYYKHEHSYIYNIGSAHIPVGPGRICVSALRQP